MTDKTAQDAAEAALKEVEGGNLNLWDVPDNKEMRTYWKEVYAMGYAKANQKISSLEAEVKRLEKLNETNLAGYKNALVEREKVIDTLEEQLGDTKILLESAKRAIEERDELLKAAEEVIGVSRILGHFSSPDNPFWKSLKKYQSLKENAMTEYASIKEKEAINRTVQECIDLINNYWRFDSNQQPISSWHDKQDLIEKLKQ